MEPIPEFLLPIAERIYPLPESPTKRTRKLQVICLGLPRSGTDSLHTALGLVGYQNVSHGFVWWASAVETSLLYYKLGCLVIRGKTPSVEVLRRDYFDRVLGQYDATTDVPSVWFADLLLQAYPDAQVILNRRRDTKAWKKSFRDAVLPMMLDWKYWLASWFQAELFWGLGLTNLMHQRALVRGDFERESEKAYVEHYDRLEAVLKEAGRPYLDWSVEEGWAPLCKFLDKQQPGVEFPSGNVASEFGPRLMQSDKRRFAEAKNNALMSVAALVAGVVIVLYWRWD